MEIVYDEDHLKKYIKEAVKVSGKEPVLIDKFINNEYLVNEDELNKIAENSFAFAVMVFFLEFIILIGVAFSTYYEWTSFTDMKQVLATPKFKQLELNLKLLKLYYQNNRKKEGDSTLSLSKFKSLVSLAKVNCSKKDVNDFVALCSELDITSGKRNKTYNVSYEKAKQLLENQQDELV